jgi:hypothetical protein
LKNEKFYYYEIELLTMTKPCYPQFGFAGPKFLINSSTSNDAQGQVILLGVGDDKISWAVDGERRLLWHDGRIQWLTDGPTWQEGDVIGIACDMNSGVMRVSLNGNWLMHGGDDAVFRNVFPGAAGGWLYPVLSGKNMSARCNFGKTGFKFATSLNPPRLGTLSVRHQVEIPYLNLSSQCPCFFFRPALFSLL